MSNQNVSTHANFRVGSSKAAMLSPALGGAAVNTNLLNTLASPKPSTPASHMSHYKSETETMNSAKASQRQPSERSDNRNISWGPAVDGEDFEAGARFLKQNQLQAQVQQYMPQSGQRLKTKHSLKWEGNAKDNDDFDKKKQYMNLLNNTTSTMDVSNDHQAPKLVNRGLGHVKVARELTTVFHEKVQNEHKIHLRLKKARVKQPHQRASSTVKATGNHFPEVNRSGNRSFLDYSGVVPNYNRNMAMATTSGFMKSSRPRLQTPKRNKNGALLQSSEPGLATDTVFRNLTGFPEIGQSRTGAQASFFAVNGTVQPEQGQPSGKSTNYFSSNYQLGETQPGSDVDMVQRPSLLSSNMMFKTHSQLNGRASDGIEHADQTGGMNFDSAQLSGNIKGEMSTMGQMLKETMFKDSSEEAAKRHSQQLTTQVSFQQQLHQTNGWQSPALNDQTLEARHASGPAFAPSPAMTSSANWNRASGPSEYISQSSFRANDLMVTLHSLESQNKGTFYYDPTKQRKDFMNSNKRNPRRMTTLPSRKLSVQSHMLGGQAVKSMMKARHAEDKAENEAQKQAMAGGQTPKQSPSRTKESLFSGVSKQQRDLEDQEEEQSENSSSDNSEPDAISGRTPGASIPTDTPAGRLARRIVNKLSRQEEPDFGEIHRITDSAKRGLLKLLDLQLQYQALKRKADLKAKEAFASTYTDELIVGLDPLQHRQRYLMVENPKHMIKLMDNVIYAKQKLVTEDKQSPQRGGIFLNRRDISKWQAKQGSDLDRDDESVAMPSYNRYTKDFQEQQQQKDICEVAKLASRLLYRCYADDERFNVDVLERTRLGIDVGEEFKVMNCEEHGGASDAFRARKRAAYQKALVFYEDLKDPRHNKVDRDLQARALLKNIRTSDEPEFIELRKELEDTSENRDLTYEELRKLRPEIFLKDKAPAPDHQWHNTAAKDVYEISNVVDIEQSHLLSPSQKRVLANRMVLETFTNTFKPPDDSAVRPNFDTEQSMTFDESKSEHEKVEIYKEDYEKRKFYDEQKIICNNPKGIQGHLQHNYLNHMQGHYKDYKGTIEFPLFTKIRDGVLELKGFFMDPQMMEALTKYIEQGVSLAETPKDKLVQHLIIDGCNYHDAEFAAILRAVTLHKQLQSISYSNNGFGKYSVEALEYALSHCSDLDTLSFSNLTIQRSGTDYFILEQLLKTLTELGSNVKRVKLNDLDLNNERIQRQLLNFLSLDKGLIDFDLSFCKIQASQLAKIGATLLRSGSKLKHINLSYINLDGQDRIQRLVQKRLKSTHYIADFIRHLCDIIEQKGECESSQLQHLDLSGMNLKEQVKPLLMSVHQSSRNSMSHLVSIHLNDNQFDQDVKDYIIQKMKVETNDQDKLLGSKAGPGRHAVCEAESAQERRLWIQGHNFFKVALPQTIGEEDTNVLNHGISKHFRKLKEVALEGSQPSFGKKRNVIDPFILTRKLGRPELVFSEDRFTNRYFNPSNALGCWRLESGALGDDCYLCQQYAYVQIFFTPSRADREFKRIEDPNLIKILRESCNLDTEGSVPFLLSSINNWLPTRLMDVKIFSTLIKSADPVFAKENAGKLKTPLKDLTTAQLSALKTQYIEYLQNPGKLGKDNNDAGATEYDQGEPDKRKFEGEMLWNHDFDRDLSKMDAVFENVKEAVYGESIHGYSQLLGINPYESLIDDYSRTSIGWKSVLKSLSSRMEMCSVNYPEGVDDSESIFTFAGFVRPGRHAMIIYDPSSKTFHQRDLIIEPRRGEIPTHIGTVAIPDQFKVLAEEYIDVLDHKKFVFFKSCLESDQKLQKLFKREMTPEFMDKLPNQFKYQVMDHIQDNFATFYKVYQMCRMCALQDFTLPEQLEEFGVKIDWNFRKHGLQFGVRVHGDILTRKKFIESIYTRCLEVTNAGGFSAAIEGVLQAFTRFYDDNESSLDPMHFRLNQLWRTNVNQVLRINLKVIEDLFWLHSSRPYWKDTAQYIELHQVKELLLVTGLITTSGGAPINVCKCFEQSKQFGNEGHTLCFLEFVEFLCRVANDYYAAQTGWSLWLKVQTFLKDKLMPPFCRGIHIQTLNVSPGQDDPRGPPIFEWPVGEEQVKKPVIKKNAPTIPQYTGSKWHSMAGRLPVGLNKEDVALRKSLWRRSDTNGNGYLALTEIFIGLRQIWSEDEVAVARPAVRSAFTFARDYNKSATDVLARDFVEAGEYRAFLLALKARLEYSHAFGSIDSGGPAMHTSDASQTGDGRISLKEFLAAQHMIDAWVGKLVDPAAEFRRMDADSGGTVSFSEFCDWATSRHLTLDSYDSKVEGAQLTLVD